LEKVRSLGQCTSNPSLLINDVGLKFNDSSYSSSCSLFR
jgi:hypothetical protein